MENFQIRKSLRFKLESNENNNLIEDKIDNIYDLEDFDLVNFSTKLGIYLNNLKNYLFYENEEKKLCTRSNLIVRKECLKIYAKQELAKVKQKEKKQDGENKQYSIKDLKLEDKIKQVYEFTQQTQKSLLEVAKEEEYNRARKSKISILLKRLSAKNSLPMLVDLVENIIDKKETTNTSLILMSAGKNLIAKLEQGILYFLPEQSNGVVIAKASFNYYTINKTSGEYSDKIKELENSIIVEEEKLETIFKNKKEIINDILDKADGKQLHYGNSPIFNFKKHASLRQILKNIRAEQKSEFNEQMQYGITYKKLQESDLYLFSNIEREDFDKYSELTEEIENLAAQKSKTNGNNDNNSLNTSIKNKKKQRGSILQNKFKDYISFSETYKEIAKTHGKLYSQLIGIEKEKAESQLLNYWAMLLEENNQHKLVLIPKENAQVCYKRVKESNRQAHDAKLYWFESFTYRSLQKLCFGNPLTNTFYPNIKELVGNISGEYKFNNDQEKIKFYKDVLNTSYAKSTLSLPNEELKESVINKDFNSLDDFKIALEQVCYKRNVKINPALIKSLEEEFDAQILDITSYDLRRTNETYPNKEKAHTKIWREFWSEENKQNNFDTRLNPEISIVYRKAKESRVVKYKIDPKMNNRYLYEQLTLVTSFSQYCNSPSKNLSFLTTEKVQETINKFNENINKEKFSFALGIDNGEVELSTLGVYLPEFNDGGKKSKLEKFKDVGIYGFETLTIRKLKYKEKDYKGEDREIIRNASYFLNEELYCRTFNKTSEQFKEMFKDVFEIKHTLTLDLSTAKVINGHIVTNGDVISLYNLWLKHAQRNIYEMNDHGKKETIRNIKLIESEKLNETEKRYIVDSLNRKNNRYNNLSDDDKIKYIDWLYKSWAKKEEENEEFERVKKKQMKGNYLEDFLLAASYVGDNLEPVKEIANFEPIRHIFKFREDFVKLSPKEEIMKKIDEYNTKEDVTKKDRISNEELDLKLNQLKSSLVANAIGVIDFLYKQYKERFKGEGLIVKEFKGESDVDKMREKFSINIYRMLEMKLYQKFQNYGLVPPIKNIIEIREEDKEDKFSQVGVICFVNESGTSQECPICEKGKLNHTETCSENCGFNSKDIMHSNDGIAGCNIAKKGFIEVTKK